MLNVILSFYLRVLFVFCFFFVIFLLQLSTCNKVQEGECANELSYKIITEFRSGILYQILK